MQALSAMSSAQIVSATAIHNNNKGLHMGLPPLLYPHMTQFGTPYSTYNSSPVHQVSEANFVQWFSYSWAYDDVIHSFIKEIYIAPFQGYYSEVLLLPTLIKRTVLELE